MDTRLGDTLWPRLLAALPTPAAEQLIASGKVLDNFYIPAQCPSGVAEGAPFEHCGSIQSDLPLGHARDSCRFDDQALAER